MNGPGLTSLEDVYKKWEKKGAERRQNPSRNVQSNVSSGRNGVQPTRTSWLQKFDDGAVSRRRTTRRKHQDVSFNALLSAPVERKFHLIPPVIEDLHRSARPFLSSGCPRCCQKSKTMFITEKATSSPLRNLLDLSMFCRKSLLRRVFSDILYIADLPCMLQTTQMKTTTVKNAVLKSPRVCSTIERLSSTSISNPSSEQQDEEMAHKASSPTSKELKLEAKQIIAGMTSSIKGYLIKLSTWFLFKFFRNITSSIHVHQGQITMLHEATKKNVPIVYLPLHKSHVDYVLLSFVLSCYGLKVPYIAAGDNLKDIPVFSWLMRNMGGFFIKRSLGDTSPQNDMYRVILNEYIAQILESGNSLELYIEGTRSRTGKCYPPKIGVLSSILSAVKEGRVSDVLIVPVNISYEKILESGYSGELLGEPKKTESFMQTVKGIWRILWSHFGQVRVDFGLPCSLMDLIHASEMSEACQTFMKTTTMTKTSPTLTSESCALKNSVSEILLESLDCSIVSLTKTIAYHVVYDCVRCSTIMGTNMVAFLLLTRFRKGVEIEELASTLELLKKDILIRKRDYGFSGSNEAVISHSLNILGKELVHWDPASPHIRPNLSLPAILQLTYYSNQVLSVYVLESVVACSIGALLADEDISLSELIYQNVTISRKELLDTAMDLCDLLRREFVFTQPCVSLETSLIEAIESFIASDVLNVCEDQSSKSREKQWANRLAASTSWFDDDSEDEGEIPDQEYKVNSSKDAVKKLMFFYSMLSPIIEAYWFVACSFLWLRNQDFTEKDFMNALVDSAILRVEVGTALHNESCSIAYLTNAVKVFKECSILHSTNHGDKSSSSLLQLDNGYQTEKGILGLINDINRYKLT